MSILIYLDTNVYIDYFEDRRDSMRPLGEFAFNVLKRTFGCEFKIVVSDLIIEELEKFIVLERINKLIADLKEKNKVRFITQDDIDCKNAAKLPTHYTDALHAILAIKGGAKFLVTRNMSDYISLGQFIKPVLPENL